VRGDNSVTGARSCGRRSRADAAPPGVSPEKAALVLNAWAERRSLRGAARTFGMSRNTICALLPNLRPAPKKDALMLQEQARSGIGYLEATPLPAQQGDVLELDAGALWADGRMCFIKAIRCESGRAIPKAKNRLKK